MTAPYLDVDLTKTSAERLAAYANNIFTQLQYSAERTTLVDFVELDESRLPTYQSLSTAVPVTWVDNLIKNARLMVNHDRIGDGLQPFVQVPSPAVTDRTIEYHRTSAQEIIEKYGNVNGKLVVTTTANSIQTICDSLNTDYGLFLTPEDITTTYVSHAATKYLQINAGSVLYKGVIAIAYADFYHGV